MTALLEAKPCTRGTSNSNERGSADDRRRRKLWLIETYRANVDLEYFGSYVVQVVPAGTGTPTCRCYRCGDLLTYATVTVDRIIPGCMGGTYRRNNIRPACGNCNSETGGKLSGKGKRR